ncbi:DEAD/DEAH box helicase [Lacibacter luteus]|uniref:DEAD/DEAH box helicase n=1 Tax=Lacibacter luteus TaxID=2508719 RepID=A0A4Q1CN43_9BACT|nr:DEAD/DEAH box helicase [Lacibacter luteus]RXK62145.1 DEAD/DEAH box helicase [Lacibacter luteus]
MQQQPEWLSKALNNLNIKALNEMQEAALTATAQHKDLILLSATGSGKTLAFLLPLVEQLQQNPTTTTAIIIVPSRELALQIETVFKSLQLNLKVTCCYGGHKREIEENNLKQAPALLIGTPGRLADHIRRESINTKTITTLVLDEFDKSLELGFQEEVSFIIGSMPNIEERMLTSATRMEEIPAFVGLQQPVTLDFLNANEEKEIGLSIQLLQSEEKDKIETLFRLICMLGNRSTIVFCNHREAVERTSALLKERDIVNVFYHGAMEQRDRDAALCKFRNGTSNVLVTTDLAARGLDIANIRYIVHYHLPHNEDTFTHRNGRTARMEASGTAIVILGPEETKPEYIPAEAEEITLPTEAVIPDKPKWTTLFIAAGKKDKVNKIDIVGFLSNKGDLKKEDIGLIEVKDFFAFVAVKKIKASHTLNLIKDEKIKGKKVKIAVAK